MEAIVFIILQMFFRNTQDLKIGECHSDITQVWLGYVQSRVTFRSIARERNIVDGL